MNTNIKNELKDAVKCYYKPSTKSFKKCVAFKLKRLLYLFEQLREEGVEYPQQDRLDAFQRQFKDEIPLSVKGELRDAWVISTDSMFDLYLDWLEQL